MVASENCLSRAGSGIALVVSVNPFAGRGSQESARFVSPLRKPWRRSRVIPIHADTDVDPAMAVFGISRLTIAGARDNLGRKTLYTPTIMYKAGVEYKRVPA
jgi:hypothetical protein